jgi:ribosomal protein S18 acetylase RimI-like enzyme
MCNVVAIMQPTLIPEELAPRAIASLTLSFAGDPMARWSWRAPELFLASFPRFIRGMAGQAFGCGSAYAIDDMRGVALWLPPGERTDDAVLEALFEESIPEEQGPSGAKLAEVMAAHHPREPHWYLPLIGVEPLAQGRGLGARLMQPVLEICDRDGVVAYLESSNGRNIPFYERLGFRVLARLHAGDSPELVPMLREPIARRA